MNTKYKILKTAVIAALIASSNQILAGTYTATSNMTSGVAGTTYDNTMLTVPIPSGTVVNVSGYVSNSCDGNSFTTCVPVVGVGSGSHSVVSNQLTSHIDSQSFGGTIISNGSVHVQTEASVYSYPPSYQCTPFTPDPPTGSVDYGWIDGNYVYLGPRTRYFGTGATGVPPSSCAPMPVIGPNDVMATVTLSW